MVNVPTALRTYPDPKQGCFYATYVDAGTSATGAVYPLDGKGQMTSTAGSRLGLTLDGIDAAADYEVEVVSVSLAGGVTVFLNSPNGVLAELVSLSCTTTVGGVSYGNMGIRFLGGLRIEASVSAGSMCIGFRIHKYSKAPS